MNQSPAHIDDDHCVRCCLPVTSAQLAAGKTVETLVGIFHSRCLAVWMARIERTVEEAFRNAA